MSRQDRNQHFSPISNLFLKYQQTLKPPQASIEKIACAAIFDTTGITIDRTAISYTVSTRMLYLSVPSVLKTELMFRRGEILLSLQEKLGRDRAPLGIL